MGDLCISLRDVSLRFRMSYDRAATIPEHFAQAKKRLLGRWRPEEFTALDAINLDVRRGEIVGVIGRNGAGKTTLLRAVSGIYHPDSGHIHVNGRISALLSLGTGFNVALSGRENIVLGGLTLGYTLPDIEERMDIIIEFAELGDFIDVPTRYYSSGMMSRLSFAMVISMEPDILLIDETLSVGDLSFAKKAQQAMNELLERASCQMIVSHSLPTVQRLCNRAILIDRGRVVVDGEPAEVIERYEKMVGVSNRELTLSPAEVANWEN